jgi:hypothetical protein
VSDKTVYVSRKPEVLKAWEAAGQAIQDYVDATQAVLNATGLGEYKTWRSTNGWHPGEFVGLAIPAGIPVAGWRMLADYAVPDKRLKQGKAIDAALKAVKHPGDPRAHLIGMPADVMAGGGFQTPAVRLLDDGTALYVAWRTDPAVCSTSFMSKSTEIDADLWGRVPLSVYYAAVEAHDASKAAGVTV